MAWAPDYITVEQLRGFLGIDDTDDDVELAVAITAASRAVDDHCNRQFGLVAAAAQRFYTAHVDIVRRMWVVDIDDLMTETGLAITITDVGTVTTYYLEPINAASKARPWTRVAIDADSAALPTGAAHEMAVTARWGWTTVPTAVTQATYLQSSRFFARRKSPYGIAGSPDEGSEMRLLSRLDPDVAVSLRGLQRTRAVG